MADSTGSLEPDHAVTSLVVDPRLELLRSEIAALRAELDNLAGRIVELESRMDVLEVQWWTRLGPRVRRLAALETTQATRRHEENPTSATQTLLDEALQRAAAAAAASGNPEGPRNALSDPTTGNSWPPLTDDEVQNLFIRAAKLYHPDRAVDENDRARRLLIMQEVNRARESGDADRIRDVLARHGAGSAIDDPCSSVQGLTALRDQLRATVQKAMTKLALLEQSSMAHFLAELDLSPADEQRVWRRWEAELDESINQLDSDQTSSS
jgi:hypothetical protein